MSIVVQKYGGSSLADAGRIRNVAARIARAAATGQVVVTVSAMGDTTDHLIELAHALDPEPPAREMDLLLSTGEIVSSTLMVLALGTLGVPAVALTGRQAGIRTDAAHSRARITGIDPDRIRRELERGKVVIVAGFQGVSEADDITTLGRGGSDTTAVALAVALGADRAEIYTDVRGIYTADPRLAPQARQLAEIDYEEMLELATWGARVMHPRAVELGLVYGMPILVASSFADSPGTLIHAGAGRGGAEMEKTNKVRGIAHEMGVAKVTIQGVPDQPGIAASIFAPLAEQGISVDVIVQNASTDRRTDLSFTVADADLAKAAAVAKELAGPMGAAGVATAGGLAKVSIVGAGMQTGIGFAARMFQALSAAGVNIEMITTSEIRITCIVEAEATKDAVQALHKAFELDAQETVQVEG